MPGSGPNGTYLMTDLGYNDPILLAQLNTQYITQTLGQDLGPLHQGVPASMAAFLNAPTPQAAKEAFTGMPGQGTNPPTGASPVWNPLADINASFSVNDLIGAAGKAGGCELLPTETARKICRSLTGATPPATGGTTAEGCLKGYHKNAAGQCVIDGIGSIIPGDVGNPDVIWTPVNGRFGQGATPVMIQQNHLACPTGMVLGKDNVCYEHLARSHRKWNPGAKPLLTGGEMNAIRTTKRVEKKWKRLASGFHKKVVPAGARLKKAPK